MGQIADDILDGIQCQLCGCIFKGTTEENEAAKKHDPKCDGAFHRHGYPVVCWDCWNDLDKRTRKMYQRATVPTF